MSDQDSVDYLSIVDAYFVRMHRGHGVPVAMQGLWMLDEVVDDDLLTEVHRRLSVGPLNRRVIRPRIHGGRHYWVRGASIPPVFYTPEPVAREDIVTWADERAQVRLNPEHGIGWELGVARLEDGGTVMSLVCSHALTDAQGMISAVNEAVGNQPVTQRPMRTKRHSIWHEFLQALRQYWAVLLGSFIAFYTIFIKGSNRDEIVRYLRKNRVDVLRRKRAATLARTGKLDQSWREPGTLIDIEASDWDAIAAKSGGTPNSLLIGIAANLLFSSGARGAHESITIGVPVDLSEVSEVPEAALRKNDLTLAPITLRPRGTRYGELFLIRDKCREKFQAAVTEGFPQDARPAGMPTEILDIVPDRISARLVRTTGTADAVATYIGQLPQTMAHLGPYAIESAAARAVHPGITAIEALESPFSLDLCLLRNGNRYTLSVLGVNPLRFPDPQTLRNLVIRELEKWGLVPQSWDSDQPGLGLPGGPSSLF
ncbi:hypothetical protein [Hoyosella subflava]|uniref:Diacylglycerol O-acyltransferase n=1 Tax=Hoyosella subflava (strain DSM 45089 / JCM 17490 / NBRC 109087 / DQS3-9A1) TaxID=443218 RepID=F6ES23_HOYSD|nr:hypothetical protein [Hoyosella subflava]AEF42027.1 hypothetical protein AS9A_3589 [Hoyosella subflava DQS3-9A1]